VRIAPIEAAHFPKAAGEFPPALGLTGLGAAKAENVPARWFTAEIVIEADHALDFGARDIEDLGNQGIGLFGNVAEAFHQTMERGQEPAFASGLFFENGARLGAVPAWFHL